MKKVFLEDLPKWEVGNNKGNINWENCAKEKTKVKFIYENISGEVTIVNYEKEKRYLSIRYLGRDSKMSIKQFTKCHLGRLVGVYTNNFKIEIGQQFRDDKRDLIITDKEVRKDKNNKNLKWYKYKCNKCGWEEGWVTEGNLLSGVGCACCGVRSTTTIEGINDIPSVAPWMVQYFQGGFDEAKLYTKGSNKKIYPICPNCGHIKDKPVSINYIYAHHSIGCPKCSDGCSYPSKIMFNVLEQLNIKFITEYSPNWCKFEINNKVKTGRYDFYFELNDNKYIVEIDGDFHNSDNKMNKQSAKESQQIDKCKDQLAIEHNIRVIRIMSEKSKFDYLKNNILDSELNKLFNLKNIKWEQCENFALTSLMKKACDLKNNNHNLTAKNIGELLKLNRVTIADYLKKGTKLGWCEYSPKEELLKGSSKLGKMSGKPIEIFKEGVSLGKFSSCTELEHQSKQLFGTKLWHGSILRTASNKQKQYKGYTFSFLN